MTVMKSLSRPIQVITNGIKISATDASVRSRPQGPAVSRLGITGSRHDLPRGFVQAAYFGLSGHVSRCRALGQENKILHWMRVSGVMSRYGTENAMLSRFWCEGGKTVFPFSRPYFRLLVKSSTNTQVHFVMARMQNLKSPSLFSHAEQTRDNMRSSLPPQRPYSLLCIGGVTTEIMSTRSWI